jgi:ABC-type transport system involved in multi-copper enzyme maturation permease subunit
MSAHPVAVLLGHLLRRHWRPLAAMSGGLALFQLVMTRMAPAPNEVSWMSQIMSAVPSELRALAGDEAAPITPGGFLGLGYSHPFFMVLLSTWVIRVTSSALAGEIGLGTMDLLAARPVSRWHHITAALVFVATGLVILIGAAWCGTAFGLTIRPLGIEPRQILAAGLMAWLLFAAWTGVGLLVSATRREAGPAIAVTSAIVAVSFVLEYIARVWKPVASLRPFSLFSYYRPQGAIVAGIHATDGLTLAAVAVVGVGLALVVFTRRDL